MIDAQHLTELRRVAALAPSPDGAWLAVAVARLHDEDSKYVHDLWRVPLDGSAPECLTPGPFDDRAPRFRDDGALLFLSNRPAKAKPEEGETDRAQIWCLPPRGEARRLTDEPLGVAAFDVGADLIAAFASVWPGVPHDAQRAHARDVAKHGPSALRYRRGPVRFWDHYEPAAARHVVAYDADGGARRDLTPDADAELRPDPELVVRADGGAVIVTVAGEPEGAGVRAPGERLRRTWLRALDPKSGAVVAEAGAAHRGLHGGLCRGPGGRVACTRTTYLEAHVHPRELVLFEGLGAEPRVLGAGVDRRLSPEAFLDEDTLLVSYDDGGETRLGRLSIEADALDPLEAGGTHQGARRIEGGYVGVAHTLTQPPRPFVVQGGERRWLAELSGLAPDALAGLRVERFGVEASDGASVDCRLVLPPGEGPFPLLFWIHGGPISFFGDTWHWRWNAAVMAQAGYAVALPNARGSTGYGYEFIDGIWGNRWGEQCFDDLMRVADALGSRADVDGARMVAMGGSFGGYMANWIGGQTERFAAIVTHASLYDLRSFYGATDNPAYFGLHNASTPWSGEIDRYSPHRFVSRWKTPTLILHGDKDYRVPVTEALALFEALQAHGVESELVVFPDENHWILKPRNIRAWYGAVIEFLERTLP